MMALGAGAIVMGAGPAFAHVRSGAGAALFWIMAVMIFAPKFASSLNVLGGLVRFSYGGSLRFLLNIGGEIVFSFCCRRSSPSVKPCFCSGCWFSGAAARGAVSRAKVTPYPGAWRGISFGRIRLRGSAILGIVALRYARRLALRLAGRRRPRAVRTLRRRHVDAVGRRVVHEARHRADSGRDGTAARSRRIGPSRVRDCGGASSVEDFCRRFAPGGLRVFLVKNRNRDKMVFGQGKIVLSELRLGSDRRTVGNDILSH